MFYYLKGALTHLETGIAVIDVGGVGYKLTISQTTYDSMPSNRSVSTPPTVLLYTYMAVREDGIELFGFASETELSSFKLLISVSGVGPKAAMSILSLLSPEKFALAVCTEDKKTIAKANNPKNVESIKLLGVDIVISATDSIISLLEREVDHSAIKELIPLNDGKAAVYQIELPEHFAFSGTELLNVRLPESCNIISITRNGELIIPRGKTKLLSGDELLIVSLSGSINEVRKALKLKK